MVNDINMKTEVLEKPIEGEMEELEKSFSLNRFNYGARPGELDNLNKWVIYKFKPIYEKHYLKNYPGGFKVNVTKTGNQIHHMIALQFSFSLLKENGNTANMYSFSLEEMFHNCGIVVAHSAKSNVTIDFLHKYSESAKEILDLIENIARVFGYPCVLYTFSKNENDKGLGVILKSNWNKISAFKNLRNSHRIIIYQKLLKIVNDDDDKDEDDE